MNDPNRTIVSGAPMIGDPNKTQAMPGFNPTMGDPNKTSMMTLDKALVADIIQAVAC